MVSKLLQTSKLPQGAGAYLRLNCAKIGRKLRNLRTPLLHPKRNTFKMRN